MTWVFLMVLVFVADQMMASDWVEFGLRPRSLGGLLGIITGPWLHASWGHLLSNAIPLGVGFSLMLYLYPHASVRALPVIYLGSGVLVWCVGREAIHVGASGLVYGVLAFLFTSGLVRRDRRSLGVAMMVAFVYGSIIWGLLPYDSTMSWELHVAGTMLGLGMAVGYRRFDCPPMVQFDWEIDENEDQDNS